MKTIKDILVNAEKLTPGRKFIVRGYVSSAGLTINYESLLLLGPSGYHEMQQEDLVILRAFSVTEDIEGVSSPDLELALRQLITAREKVKEANPSYAGYTEVGDAESSLKYLESSPDSVYILRAKNLGDVRDPSPAKGSVPRAKQILARHLKLPSRRYVHSLKLTNGRFDEISEA